MRLLSSPNEPRPVTVSVPSDSVTTTVKNLTAPLTSLNQLQLNLKKMEDLVATAALSLTRVLRGGTGGPEGILLHLHYLKTSVI